MEEQQNESQPKSFNDLPDELVCHVMTQLSSMGDKLKIGAVSRRFHRCANDHLRNCVWPLELHFTQSMFDSWRLFEVDVRAYLTRILTTMARKTCFSKIILHVHNSKEMASVQHACQSLTQHPECLSKTKEFKIDYDGKTVRSLLGLELVQPNNPNDLCPLPDVTYDMLGHCSALSMLHLSHIAPDVAKLQASLSGKGLTEIVLDGIEMQCEALTEFFTSLKPNTLKTVSLNIKMEKPPNWTIAQFFEQMRQGPWLAVEDLRYNFKKVAVPAADFNLMGDLLDIFPNLVKCSPHCSFSFQPTVEDHIECINRFLKSGEKSRSGLERSVTFGQSTGRMRWSACNLVTLMERIIDRYPERSCKLTFQRGSRSGAVVSGYTLSLCSREVTTFKISNLGISACGGILAQGPFILGEGGFIGHDFNLQNLNVGFGLLQPPANQNGNAQAAEPAPAPQANDGAVQANNPQANDAPAAAPVPAAAPNPPAAANNLPPWLQGLIGANPQQQGPPPCAVCRRFYGTAIKHIMRNIQHQQGGHIDDYFMNPCQAQRMLGDVKALRPNEQVQMNRDAETGRYAIDVGDLQITVDAQACIVPGCSECLENLI